MTAKELIGILLESPFYLDMDLRERVEMVKTYLKENPVCVENHVFPQK